MAYKKGKLISIFSTKGGVGKTVLTLSMAGIYSNLGKKVLILDMDFVSGGVGVSLGVSSKRSIYNFVDDLNNKRYKEFEDYISKYNENIDVIISPIDPRESNKIESKFVDMILGIAVKKYDIVLVDTNHIFSDNNLILLDKSDVTLLIVTNDPIDLKNMKSLISIFKDSEKSNYKVLLNNSRDTDKDYLTNFDIKNIIKNNIDYTISSSFHIKDIDKYTLNREILTLNKKILSKKKGDIKKITQMARDLINIENGGDRNDKEKSS